MLAHIEFKFDDIAVLHHVVTAFLTQLAFLLDLGHGAVDGHEIVVGDDVSLDEALFEVGVNHAGGLRGGPALVDLPSAHFLDACGQEGLQAEDVEAHAGQLVETGLAQASISRASASSSSVRSASN